MGRPHLWRCLSKTSFDSIQTCPCAAKLLVKRARIEGFVVADYRPRYHEAQAHIGDWIDQGKIKYKIDDAPGLKIYLPRSIACLPASMMAGCY
jgi:NADPH-dependent curcumin reductase CurA